MTPGAVTAAAPVAGAVQVTIRSMAAIPSRAVSAAPAAIRYLADFLDVHVNHVAHAQRVDPARDPVELTAGSNPSRPSCRDTIRRKMTTPSSVKSNAMRRAHQCRRRRHAASMANTTAVGFAVGWCNGVEDRSTRPPSPYRRHRLTHFDAH